MYYRSWLPLPSSCTISWHHVWFGCLTIRFVQQPNVPCNTTNIPLVYETPSRFSICLSEKKVTPPPLEKKNTQLTLIPKTISIKMKRYNTLITSGTYQCLPGAVGTVTGGLGWCGVLQIRASQQTGSEQAKHWCNYRVQKV